MNRFSIRYFYTSVIKRLRENILHRKLIPGIIHPINKILSSFATPCVTKHNWCLCVSWQIEKHWTLTQMPRMFKLPKEPQEESNVHRFEYWNFSQSSWKAMDSEDLEYSSWLVWTTFMVLLYHFWTLTAYSHQAVRYIKTSPFLFYKSI